MFKLNLKIALRNLWKNKGYTLINILGLSVGLAIFCIVLLFVNHETNYDRFDDTLERVYRVYSRSGEKKSDYMTYLDAELIKANEPGVEDFTRIESLRNDQEVLAEANGQSFYLDKIIIADANFFDFFPFKLSNGDKKTVFSNINSIVLTKTMSKKIFGDKDPINQTLNTKDIFNNVTTYTITGVVDDSKANSHIEMNACVYKAKQDYQKTDRYGVYNIYLKLKPGVSQAGVEKKAKELIAERMAKNAADKSNANVFKGNEDGVFLEAIQGIHLRPKIDSSSNLPMVKVLGVLAIAMLLLVCINFTNLLVARSFKRAKEVGVRKVLGAQVPTIIFQFIIEVVLQIVIAFLIGMVLMELILPPFNAMLNLQLTFWRNSSFSHILIQITGLLALTILLTGGYPAWYLSKFQPAKVLKGDINRSKTGTMFRSGLLVLQFAISVLFIAGMLLVKQQVSFIRNQDPGFSAAQVIAVKAQTTPTVYEKFNTLKTKLSAIPGVDAVSKTTFLPGGQLPISLPLKYQENIVQTKKIAADIGYFDLMKIPVVAGRVYTGAMATDTTDAIVLNEAAVKALGITDPIGKMVTLDKDKYDKYVDRKIIGVIKDVNMQGFETAVQPAFYVKDLLYGGGWQNQILIGIKAGQTQKTLDEIKAVWASIEPGYPMKYTFIDEAFDKSFEKYIRLSNLFNAFTLLSILITIIGLFALIALVTAQRTKEIGIRKVLGATNGSILLLLNKSFFTLVIIGNLIALPVVYILAKEWLNTFAYQMEMPFWPYFAAIVASIAIALFTVTMQAFRAIRTNPIHALKYE